MAATLNCLKFVSHGGELLSLIGDQLF